MQHRLPVTASQVRMSEYNQLKGQLGALNRKQGGNLSVRDLGDFVKKEHIISTENITTVFAVISKYSKGEWLQSYESLVEYVVGAALDHLDVTWHYPDQKGLLLLWCGQSTGIAVVACSMALHIISHNMMPPGQAKCPYCPCVSFTCLENRS